MKKTTYLKFALSTGAVALLLACAGTPKDTAPWLELLPGEQLEGWTPIGGTAPYRVEGSTIIGTSVHDSPQHLFNH